MKKHLLIVSFIALLLLDPISGYSACESGNCQNGYGTFVTLAGSKYEGNWKNDLFHGKGKLTLADGTQYEGAFQNGTMEGNGVKKMVDGSHYEGEFHQGLYHGEGILTTADGKITRGIFYRGNLENITAETSTELYTDKKDSQKADITTPEKPETVASLIHTFEAEQSTDKEQPTESQKETVPLSEITDKHTQPTTLKKESSNPPPKEIVPTPPANKTRAEAEMTLADGSRYVGEMENGQFNGQGTKIFPLGSRYVGNWVNGKEEGKGEIFYFDGRHFQGQWRGGKKNGHGILIYADGSTYEGDFKQDEIHGQGIRKYSGGSVYEGAFAHNRKNGKGIFTFANGIQWIGEWENGRLTGPGYKKEGKRKTKGFFVDGKFQPTPR